MKFRSWFLALVICAAACSDDVEIGENRRLPAASGGASGVSGSAGSGGSLECVPRSCRNQTRPLRCGDCIDNDQDGLIDSADDECLGPCDNTEDSYYGDIPGQSNTQCRQDCYFDDDYGSGNDGCYWSHRCDPLSTEPAGYPPSADSRCAYDVNEMVPGSPASCVELVSTQSESCRAACAPLTPNGCDCFGCCELPNGSGNFVWLGSTADNMPSCDRANVDDPTKCHPCTPVTGCFNSCEGCEVCVGRAANDPSSCRDAGGGSNPEQCGPGVQPCGREGQPLCGSNQYCITGCCVTIPA